MIIIVAGNQETTIASRTDIPEELRQDCCSLLVWPFLIYQVPWSFFMFSTHTIVQTDSTAVTLIHGCNFKGLTFSAFVSRDFLAIQNAASTGMHGCKRTIARF
jgi:hypothetical protein